MRQLVGLWNLIFIGFLWGYAINEVLIGSMFWLNRNDEDGNPQFGFRHLAGQFISSALSVWVFSAGLTALSYTTAPRLRWWVLAAFVIRACGSWPLVLKYQLIARTKKKLMDKTPPK